MDRPIQVIRPPEFSLPAIYGHLKTLAQRRDLLISLTVHRLRVRYKQSVLGYLWAVLQPLLLMLIYTFVCSYLVKVPTNGTPYAIFAFSALLPWTFFSNGLSNATAGLITHSNLLSKVSFPRECVPLSYVIAAFADFLVASTILAALMLYYRIPLSMNFLWVIPAIVTLLLTLTGVALLVSAVNVRFRDVGVALPLVLQLWMFATPVVYSLSSVPHKLRFWYDLNPMVCVIDTFRGAVLNGAAPDLALMGETFVMSLMIAASAYVWFKSVEANMADLI